MRLPLQAACTRLRVVSIHAPLRGATSAQFGTWSRIRSFNPRTPAGCDLESLCTLLSNMKFQSTHPCGVRLCGREVHRGHREVSIHAPLRGATPFPLVFRSPVWCFNPRTPAGCDKTLYMNTEQIIVSIHAPLRGATLYRRDDVPLARVSIHAPLRGATQMARPVSTQGGGFNPRTPAGCDLIRRLH